MTSRWVALLVVASAGAQAQTDPASAACAVKGAKFTVEKRPVEGSEEHEVRLAIVRAGKPELLVPTHRHESHRFWAPAAELHSVCDNTLAIEVGDAVLVGYLAAPYEQNSASAFLYLPARHTVPWQTDQLGNVAGVNGIKVEATKTGFCFVSTFTHEPGEHHAVEAFDLWRCASVVKGKANVTSDPQKTWDRLPAPLRTALGTRAAFEKAFGWENGDYATQNFVTRVKGGPPCFAPSKSGQPPARDDGWICPAAH